MNEQQIEQFFSECNHAIASCEREIKAYEESAPKTARLWKCRRGGIRRSVNILKRILESGKDDT